MMKCDVFQSQNEEKKRRKKKRKSENFTPLYICWEGLKNSEVWYEAAVSKFEQVSGIMLGRTVDGLPISPVGVDTWLPLTVETPDAEREMGNGDRKMSL